MKLGIFIFRRDHRLIDNLGLIKLSKLCDTILPIFIFDKNQVNKTDKNKYYRSDPAIQFMVESLEDLDKQLKEKGSNLYLFYGEPYKIVESLIKLFAEQYETIIGFNSDFSLYAKQRDNKIIDVCEEYEIDCIIEESDLSLIDIKNLTKTKDGYKQYGAFLKHVKKFPVPKPLINTKLKFIKVTMTNNYKITFDKAHKFYKKLPAIAQHGGRTLALNKLKPNNISKFKDYNEKRNNLDYETTLLSGYLNFGCVSNREVYHIMIKYLGKTSTLIGQLYWRDFYLSCSIYLKNAINYHHMDTRYDKLKWKNSVKDYKVLWEAKTGFLLIDAAMNQMKLTGYMHNRTRMMVGVFWTKYLLINPYHPKLGSQVGYSRLLLDAVGPSQNKLNHSWITELDFPGKKYAPKGISLAGRPMNISNDVIKKFDPECIYIKRWLPHLKDIPNKDLKKWNTDIAIKYKNIHPGPIFDPKEKYQEWINICKN